MRRRAGATSCAPNPRRARRAADGLVCDPREQTGRGSPAGQGGSKWQPKTRCGVFVAREHNLAPFGFRARESAARSTSDVERCGIPRSQRLQRGGAPVPANGRRFMARQGWGACSYWPERIGGLSSSNRGQRTTDGRWSALQWGALEGMNDVVMVGGFCVVVRITAPAAALFHHGARLRDLAGSCAIKAKGTARALLDSVHTVDTGNGPRFRKKQPDLPQKVRFEWGTRVRIRLRRNRRP